MQVFDCEVLEDFEAGQSATAVEVVDGVVTTRHFVTSTALAAGDHVTLVEGPSGYRQTQFLDGVQSNRTILAVPPKDAYID